VGVDKVAASHFWSDKGDKIKQNWFLYEYANVLYAKISESPGLKAYRKKYDGDNIVAFCVYFAKRMRQSIDKARLGQIAGVTINGRYVYEFYPSNTYTQTQKLMEAAAAAWDEHIKVCTNCPNQCLRDGFEITDMFDHL